MSTGLPTGQQEPTDWSSDANMIAFIVRQILGNVSVSTPVRVVAVTNAGGVSPVGRVNVHPLVNQLDGAGNSTPHRTIFGLPYQRIQGGANAVIMDPQVGDIGLAIFADRDISAVKAALADANPGSRRRFDMSDGLFVGLFLGNVTPTQYIRFYTGGIELVSPTEVKIVAPVVEVDGNFRATGSVIAGYGTGDAVTLQGHTHNQGSDSHGDTEAPVNPPNAGT